MSIEVVFVDLSLLRIALGRSFWDIRKDNNRLPGVERERRTNMQQLVRQYTINLQTYKTIVFAVSVSVDTVAT